MNAIQTAALVLIAVSLLPLVICLTKMHLLKKYKAKAVVTTASIVSSEKRSGFKNSTYYILDIKYAVIENGLLYPAQTISRKKYETGDTIPLMYLPHDPEIIKLILASCLNGCCRSVLY
ncbi:MAG: hypothetical protein IPP72_01880 [Chitinophagaceae bacterium]|nr:hypothetical protein [Chitinophagaceae bacterium]